MKNKFRKNENKVASTETNVEIQKEVIDRNEVIRGPHRGHGRRQNSRRNKIKKDEH